MSNTNTKYLSASAIVAALGMSTAALQQSAVELPPSQLRLIDVPESQSGVDITPMLQSAMLDCETEPGTADDREGCQFRIPQGQHRITETIVLCRAHSFVGDGGRGRTPATRISVAPNVTAFRVGSQAECAANGRGGLGGWATIRSVRIEAEPCANEPGGCVPRYGIQLHAQAHLEDVMVRGFTQGVRVSCDVNRATECTSAGEADCRCNANVWSMERVRVEQSAHAGVYVDGGDANAGLGEVVDVTGSCGDVTEAPASDVACAGIVDSSFLGNTWIATHTATPQTPAPGYVSDGQTQRTLWLGAYSETDQTPSVLSQNSMSVGGLSTWTAGATGVRMDGRIWTGQFSIRANVGTPDETWATFGTQNPPGTFVSFAAPRFQSAWPLRLRLSGDDYILDVAGLARGRVLDIAGTPSADLGNATFHGDLVP